MAFAIVVYVTEAKSLNFAFRAAVTATFIPCFLVCLKIRKKKLRNW